MLLNASARSRGPRVRIRFPLAESPRLWGIQKLKSDRVTAQPPISSPARPSGAGAVRPNESLRQVSHLRKVRTFAMLTCRAAPHCRGNGREHEKMAVSLRFRHFSAGGLKMIFSGLL